MIWNINIPCQATLAVSNPRIRKPTMLDGVDACIYFNLFHDIPYEYDKVNCIS